MNHLNLGSSELKSSRLIYGCMRIAGDRSIADRAKGKRAVNAAIDAGYTHFDHADIYGKGSCEELFSEVLTETPGLRERLLITSKCGIRWAGDPAPTAPHRYDFSRDWIIKSVEGSLRRLKTDYLDLFLLHRPDYLMAPDEVASTLSELLENGKVLNLGVSNFTPSQFNLLQSFLDTPLLVNQVEINIHNIDALINGTLDQCIEQNISPLAWCPIGGVAYTAWGNTFDEATELRIKKELDRQAASYGVENWVVMLSWLLLHPAKIFPIIGSTTAERIQMAKNAIDLPYTREDWYRLLEARNGHEVA